MNAPPGSHIQLRDGHVFVTGNHEPDCRCQRRSGQVAAQLRAVPDLEGGVDFAGAADWCLRQSPGCGVSA